MPGILGPGVTQLGGTNIANEWMDGIGILKPAWMERNGINTTHGSLNDTHFGEIKEAANA